MAATASTSNDDGDCWPLNAVSLHPLLRERITQTYIYPTSYSSHANPNINAVLYLPTVVLRYEQNPAFAVACHAANARNLPVIVMVVIPDDACIPKDRSNPLTNNENGSGKATTIIMTSRRLAFQLEAVSECAKSWSEHGAGVVIRVHGSNCRTPDHLTLARRCRFVVTDEPFVDPHLGLVQKVEQACRSGRVPCVRVDGSTTVPPAAVLRRTRRSASHVVVNETSCQFYDGVPAKAWMWQKETEGKRMAHVKAAMAGEFDAPALQVRIERDCFFDDPTIITEKSGPLSTNSDPSKEESLLANLLPSSWRDPQSPSPGVRPWTVADFDSLDIKQWASSWPGADSSVPPCTQTVGTSTAGLARWNNFVRDKSNGLAEYGRRRNDPCQPHAVSRMSCYLNLGIVSIFRLVHEVKSAQANKVSGADKFEEEIVKWREMSYAFCFSRADYAGINAVPRWAVQHLDTDAVKNSTASCSTLELHQLETGNTHDVKWNAMQQYLVSTGELHNNVRMTWGKTVVGWVGRYKNMGQRRDGVSSATSVALWMLCYLNDRFALDGLSPPSYAGLLWCMGWCDNPAKGGGIKQKRAISYKYGPDAFHQAESALLLGYNNNKKSSCQDCVNRASTQTSILDSMKPKSNRKRQWAEMSNASPSSRASMTMTHQKGVIKSKRGSIQNFFSHASK